MFRTIAGNYLLDSHRRHCSFQLPLCNRKRLRVRAFSAFLSRLGGWQVFQGLYKGVIRVAIKVVDVHDLGDQQLEAIFKEADVLRACRNPHILEVAFSSYARENSSLPFFTCRSPQSTRSMA